ncbi:MAG: BolA/IbaG family iron-sulfur metabolism protein [Proteobacteria bacterium]|nr:BolA/IbaG family iron-sulfur metabolism protein [Pseudomonadota bacterium]
MLTRLQRIEEKLSAGLPLSFLDVVDESSGHNVPAGAESHFKVTAVGAVFADESRIARHRRINALLQDEFDAGMHACALHLYSDVEWQKRNNLAPDSPDCAGANKTAADGV